MKSRYRKYGWPLALLSAGALWVWGSVAAQEAQPGRNLLPSGDFQIPENNKALGLDLSEGISIAQNGAERWLKFENAGTDKAVALTRSVALPPNSKLAVVSAKMKATNLKLGKEGWHEARIALRFEDDKGEMKGGYPSMPNLRADSDWIVREVVLEVPAGATRIVLQPGLWLASGTLEMDDLEVRAYPSASDYWKKRARNWRQFSGHL